MRINILGIQKLATRTVDRYDIFLERQKLLCDKRKHALANLLFAIKLHHTVKLLGVKRKGAPLFSFPIGGNVLVGVGYYAKHTVIADIVV